MERFLEGERVRLKSGGPEMIITALGAYSGWTMWCADTVACRWCEGEKQQESVFDGAAGKGLLPRGAPSSPPPSARCSSAGADPHPLARPRGELGSCPAGDASSCMTSRPLRASPGRDHRGFLPNPPHAQHDMSPVTPTVCLYVTSLVASSYGYNKGEIEHRVAHEFTAHVATQRGRTERRQHRHPPRAQPVAPLRERHGGRPRLPPRRCTEQSPHREQGHLGRRTRDEKRPNRFKSY